MTINGRMLWKLEVFRVMKKAMAYPDVTPKNTQPIPMMAVHDLKWTGERVPRTKKL